jgi:hypothetical protein
MTMTTRAFLLAGLLLATTIWSWPTVSAEAQDMERLAMARVRFTTEPALTQGCSRVGSARDDSVKDLRRKIVKMGGNTALLTFGGSEDLSAVFAEVFRCVDQPAASPGTAPARVPPPPPGPPPPPPPPSTR